MNPQQASVIAEHWPLVAVAASALVGVGILVKLVLAGYRWLLGEIERVTDRVHKAVSDLATKIDARFEKHESEERARMAEVQSDIRDLRDRMASVEGKMDVLMKRGTAE